MLFQRGIVPLIGRKIEPRSGLLAPRAHVLSKLFGETLQITWGVTNTSEVATYATLRLFSAAGQALPALFGSVGGNPVGRQLIPAGGQVTLAGMFNVILGFGASPYVEVLETEGNGTPIQAVGEHQFTTNNSVADDSAWKTRPGDDRVNSTVTLQGAGWEPSRNVTIRGTRDGGSIGTMFPRSVFVSATGTWEFTPEPLLFISDYTWEIEQDRQGKNGTAAVFTNSV